MNHWLLKTEPATFGIDDLASSPRRTTSWDGVRNYQARNTLRDSMHKGDTAFLYHSSCAAPGIVGIVRIARSGYPDATAFDASHRHFDPDSVPGEPRWFTVDVALVRKLSRLITLDELRTHAGNALADMVVLRRGNRLSVMPVTRREWDFILALE